MGENETGRHEAAARKIPGPEIIVSKQKRPGNRGDLLAAALAYYRRGWRVIPLAYPLPGGGCSCGCSDAGHKTGKHPTIKGWQSPDTPMGEPEIKKHWGKSSYNVGVCTGEISGGLLYLDIDRHPGQPDGFNALAELEKENGQLPATLTQRTGGGGEGRFFWCPLPLLARIKNRAGAASVAPGLDLRVSGGQTVVPPSLHASGRRYEWANPDAEIAEAPEWFVNLCIDRNNAGSRPDRKPEKPRSSPPRKGRGLTDPQEAYCRKALESGCSDIAVMPPNSGRNDALNRHAFRVGQLVAAGGLDRTEAESTLIDAGLRSGLSDLEARQTVESGLSGGMKEPRDLSGVGVGAGDSPSPGGEAQGGPAGVVSVPMDERPTFRVLDGWATEKETGDKLRPGVWWFGASRPKGSAEDVPVKKWVSSPIHIEAVTLDDNGGNYGRLLRFLPTRGGWREWAMPMELLRGSCDELRGELLSMGVMIDVNGGRKLDEFFRWRTPEKTIRCVVQTGWSGQSFVLPDTVIGPDASGVIFQTGERQHDEYTRAGSLDGWKGEVAARAIGNPILALTICSAFAGPVLGRCNAEGGGFHLVGDSSSGKSTALEAACSAWGGPNYRRSWRATANGMEGAASMFNDSLLALDEISECDPREVSAIVYALTNGRGKQRASRSGSARGVARWRCFVLSNGERSIDTVIRMSGARQKAGQAVRLLDIPASRSFGAWDDLQGFATGAAFADEIKRAASRNHGHAGRAFLERLTREGADLCAALEEVKALPEFQAVDGQEKRAAARFALVSLAGELATDYGVTGWPDGLAVAAGAEGFRLWKTLRGQGNDEPRAIIEAVASFIEKHGDSRFSGGAGDTLVVNRAGWWRDEQQHGRVFYFHSQGMREALSGFDFGRALNVLLEHGALLPGQGGKKSKTFRATQTTNIIRAYAIAQTLLYGDDDDEH